MQAPMQVNEVVVNNNIDNNNVLLHYLPRRRCPWQPPVGPGERPGLMARGYLYRLQPECIEDRQAIQLEGHD